MFSIKAMLNIFFFWIKIINHNISIARMTGSEYNNLEFFSQIFKDIFGSGSDIDASLYNIAGGEGDRELDLMPHVEVFVAVDEGFVKIKDYCLHSYHKVGFYLRILVFLPG